MHNHPSSKVWCWLWQMQCCVQMLELGLWMWSFAYYIYPSVLLGIIVIGTLLSGSLIYKQRKRLSKAVAHVPLVPFVHKGYVRAMNSQQLVPGDVIVVQQGVAVCDMVLLRGNCLVEESMLSGEVKRPVLSALLQLLGIETPLQYSHALLEPTHTVCNVSLLHQ